MKKNETYNEFYYLKNEALKAAKNYCKDENLNFDNCVEDSITEKVSYEDFYSGDDKAAELLENGITGEVGCFRIYKDFYKRDEVAVIAYYCEDEE